MSAVTIVVDIGGTKIAAGVASPTDISWAISHKREIPTDAARGGEAVLASVIELASQIRDEAVADGLEPIACSISSTGVIEPETGAVSYASDLMPGWTGIDLAARTGLALDIPTWALNDVHAFGLGEASFSSADRVLVVAAGTGLGSALVIDRIVDQGPRGCAGSIAHMPHPLADGIVCACGSHTGHIESVCSGSGLANLYNRDLPAGREPVTNGFDVFTRHEAGDAYATETLNASGRAMGEVLAGVVSLLDVDEVILSGSVTRSGEAWWGSLREAFSRDALPVFSDVVISEGTLGSDAPLVGAAIWALDPCGDALG